MRIPAEMLEARGLAEEWGMERLLISEQPHGRDEELGSEL